MDPLKTTFTDKRSTPRLPFATAVMFANYQTQSFYEGQMVDYGKGGMRFDTSAPIEVGSDIFIGMDSSPYSKFKEVLRARIIWSQQISPTQAAYPYSVGVQYY